MNTESNMIHAIFGTESGRESQGFIHPGLITSALPGLNSREDQTGVDSAEAEGVGEDVANSGGAGLEGHVIQVAGGVRIFQIGRGGDAAALEGEAALFATQAGVEEAWRIVAPALDTASPAHVYEPGSWGPEEANTLVAPPGGWLNPGESR